MERGASYCLPYGDYATRVPYDWSSVDQMKYREIPRHVGGGTTPNYVSSTGEFYISQKDVSQAEVKFNPSDIIIILGDGVDNFMNHCPKYGVPHF